MKYKIKDNFFWDEQNNKFTTIKTEYISELEHLNKQSASEKEYTKTHIEENIDESILYLMKDFESFIAKNLNKLPIIEFNNEHFNYWC